MKDAYFIILIRYCQEANEQTQSKIDLKQINFVLEKQGQAKWPISIKQIINSNSEGDLLLRDIIIRLKQQNFYDFFDASVSYFDNERKIYVYCFYLPKTVTENQLLYQSKYQKTIPFQKLEHSPQLQCNLKFRKKNKSKMQMLIEQQKQKYIDVQQQQTKKGKQKQKTVGQVIEKVALWRKLYTGFQNQKGQNIHLELEKAADQIGVIKKTLDDYLLQIRNGKRYGFNFHKQKNQKIGDLRSFVRNKRSENK